MRFATQKYVLPDERMKPFIDSAEIWDYLNNVRPNPEKVRTIVAKSLSKQRLNLEETACLVLADDPESIELIKNGARTLKRSIYGNRIVLFAPLYIGNECTNDCTYCGFRSSNKKALRKTLTEEDVTVERQGGCKALDTSQLTHLGIQVGNGQGQEKQEKCDPKACNSCFHASIWL